MKVSNEHIANKNTQILFFSIGFLYLILMMVRISSTKINLKLFLIFFLFGNCLINTVNLFDNKFAYN